MGNKLLQPRYHITLIFGGKPQVSFSPNRCAILVVCHGDPLQILQTMVEAAKQQEGSNDGDFTSILESVRSPEILSQHRKYALQTGELRSLA